MTGGAPQKYYALWHLRTDDEGREHDKLLGIYSTGNRLSKALPYCAIGQAFATILRGLRSTRGPWIEPI
jgi:hypothetical protein